MINQKMKWIICRRCERAVAPERVKTHLCRKHEIRCSREMLECVSRDHELVPYESLEAFKNETTTLETAISGILIEKGHKCVECGHCTPVWGSMTEHFRTEHEGKDAKEWTEGEVQMQTPFGGLLKKWFEIVDRTAMEVDEENESAWDAVKVLLAKKRRRARASTGREENVRLLNGFVARTRWDILIEGHDKKQLRALGAIAKEKDRLHKVMEVSEKYFTEISDKLRVGDVLLRRKIESEG
jgi:Orsellinic acid/F9775 biosynthesis cluster protein D